MIRSLRLWIVAPAIFLMSTPDAWTATVSDVVNQVSQSQYTTYLRDNLYTHQGDNRNDGQPDHAAAQTYIYNALSGLGLSTSLDTGTWGGIAYTNVVATIPGTTNPGQIYIVGGHYDSVNVPGADDDASGVAGVLEAARVLSQYTFGATLKFIAFDVEEDGLVGSNGYAIVHNTDNIRGMISMDMIAFNHLNPTYNNKAWVTRSSPGASATVRNALAQALIDYTGITPVTGEMGSSDHVPFTSRGDGSALLIEYAMSANQNPYYHTINDYTVDGLLNPQTWTYNSSLYPYIDYAYATDMTRGVVGYLATVAGLNDLSEVPEPASVVLLSSGVVTVLLMLRRRRRIP